jgi:hypothetical protein
VQLEEIRMKDRELPDTTSPSGERSGLKSGREPLTTSSKEAPTHLLSTGRLNIADPDTLLGSELALDQSFEEMEYLPPKKREKVFGTSSD